MLEHNSTRTKGLAIVIMVCLLAIPFFVSFGESYEADNTEGGVPGNRQESDGAGGQSCAAQPPIDASPGIYDAADGELADSDCLVSVGSPQHMEDWSGNIVESGPVPVLAPGVWYVGNAGDLVDGFAFGETLFAVFDKWGVQNANSGYTTYTSADNVLSAPAFMPAPTLERIPNLSHPGTGSEAVLSWTSMNLPNVTGYIVYRTDEPTAYNSNDGWGSTTWPYTWTAVGASTGNEGAYATSAQTLVNTSQSNPGTSGSVAYVASPGVGQSMTYTDTTGAEGTTYRYALTAVYDTGAWKTESLYRGAASLEFTFDGDPPPPAYVIDIELRSSSGIQVISAPTNGLGTVNSAKKLAQDIEAETSMQVLTISDFEKGWDDFLYRASNGNMLSSALQTETDFSLSVGEGYMVSLRYTSGSDFTWETDWDNATSAVSIDLDAGWNNVGIPYDGSGNYDTPDDLNGGSIDDAAAWVGGSWAEYTSPSWSDVQQQKAGGLTQVFGDNQNAHGFFVKASADYTWNQANALP